MHTHIILCNGVISTHWVHAVNTVRILSRQDLSPCHVVQASLHAACIHCDELVIQGGERSSGGTNLVKLFGCITVASWTQH